MNKIPLILAAALLFAGCDGANSHIDDLPRTLRISARIVTDTETGWSLSEEGFLNVAEGQGLYDGTVGDIGVTPARNSYVRSDVVTVNVPQLSVQSEMAFAYWLLPSRTDRDRDPASAEGNIRYGEPGSAEAFSLRTDTDVAEIVAAFAKNGNVMFDPFDPNNVTFSLTGTSSVSISVSLNYSGGGDIVVRDPKYRIFDETGEALTGWADYVQEGEISISSVTPLDFNITLDGIEDRTAAGSWTVVILYEDPVDNSVYVVK